MAKIVYFEDCKIEKAILKNMVGRTYVNTPDIRFNNCNINYNIIYITKITIIKFTIFF